MTLVIVPITQKAAKGWVRDFHRHHPPPVGSVFQLGLEADGALVGVLMAGRPVARGLDDGYTLEVNRTCVIDDVPNGCSKLLGAAARAARALGYRRILTYTLQSESGSSLRGAGWLNDHGVRGGRSWSCESRPRQVSMFPDDPKRRWVKAL